MNPTRAFLLSVPVSVPVKLPVSVPVKLPVRLPVNENVSRSESLVTVRCQAEPSIAEMRVESIKAGVLGAGILGFAAGLGWGAALLLGLPLPLPSSALAWLVNLAVALCSGFFFGVTYRYIVRQDDNLHLGSGAVGAFAFVRSLAQIEATWDDSFAWLTWLLVIGESFLWFATARYTLDWAMRKRWITALD